jgi:hypothetical protein
LSRDGPWHLAAGRGPRGATPDERRTMDKRFWKQFAIAIAIFLLGYVTFKYL